MIRLAILLSLALSMSACASAKIEIQADLYKEETITDRERRETREQQNLLEIIQAIAKTQDIAASCGEKGKRLAGALVDVTVAYQGLHASLSKRKFNMSAARAPFDERRPAFEKAVDDAVTRVGARADQVQLAIADYIALSLEPALNEQQRKARLFQANVTFTARVDDLNSAMKAVINELQTGTTPFARALMSNVKTLETGLDKIRSGDLGALDPPNVEQKKQSDFLSERVLALTRAINDLSPECANVPPSVPADLMAAANQLQDETLVGIHESLPAVVLGLQTLTGPLKLGPGARADIRDLAINQTFYLSQIDRLQDPADPVWREVLDPENAEKWLTVFARTSFRAEGNSDVIVVRDRPGHYRIQRGVNNPAALIQGQLEISRSVASAATAVLGAVSGVNVPLVPDKKDTSPGPVAVVPGQGDTGSLRSEAARVEEAQRVRNATRTALAVELQTIIRELFALNSPEGADKPKRDEIYARVAPILKAYADLLKFIGEVK